MVGLNGIEIKEYIGDYEVAYSGTTIITNNQTFKIVVDTLKIQFIFPPIGSYNPNEIKDGKSQHNISVQGNTLTFYLKNIPNQGNSYSDTPFRLGTLRGKQLFITFCIRQRDSGFYNFSYTLLLKSTELQ